MSFDQIILPQNVIAALYKNNLVEAGIVPATQGNKTVADIPKTTEATIQYLGKNLKKILVFVNYPEDVFIPEEHLEFLTKILTACHLDIGDIAIINTAKQSVKSLDNIQSLQPDYLLVFGECVTNIVEYIEDDFFSPTNTGKPGIVTAPALERFYKPTPESKQLKARLWGSLQQFFKL